MNVIKFNYTLFVCMCVVGGGMFTLHCGDQPVILTLRGAFFRCVNAITITKSAKSVLCLVTYG